MSFEKRFVTAWYISHLHMKVCTDLFREADDKELSNFTTITHFFETGIKLNCTSKTVNRHSSNI